MQQYADDNDGYRYILAVIDVFSKYGWMRPLKHKTGEEVAAAFKDIFDKRGCKPEKLWVDDGKEFYNKHVKPLVQIYSTQNEEKSCVVERWNRTMKGIMFKYFTANNTYRYIDVLEDIVSHYNQTKHSSINMTPIAASDPKNKHIVYSNLYDDMIHDNSRPKPKFSVGDHVRITKKHGVFDKSYLPLWTEELFEISAIQYTIPITYKIKDMNGEEIKGTFYEQELQKSSQEVFRIEKVIRSKGNKLFVKWLGYSDDFNSWIDKEDLVSLHTLKPNH